MTTSGFSNGLLSRRGFVAAVATASAGGAAFVVTPANGAEGDAQYTPDPLDQLPTLDPELARQVVLYSHSKIDRVKELVERHPELANAAMDWGFGDWESALGAASHMGRRDMAELLLANGARANIFTAAMLGQLNIVRATIEANPGAQRILGPHGFSLLQHAKAGKEQAMGVGEYLESLGDADQKYTNLALDQSQIDSLIGEYAYGAGPLRRIGFEHKKGNLRLTREGRFPRTLFHLGNLVFHPGGAPSVRINFEIEGNTATSVSLNITDPGLVARRIG